MWVWAKVHRHLISIPNLQVTIFSLFIVAPGRRPLKSAYKLYLILEVPYPVSLLSFFLSLADWKIHTYNHSESFAHAIQAKNESICNSPDLFLTNSVIFHCWKFWPCYYLLLYYIIFLIKLAHEIFVVPTFLFH